MSARPSILVLDAMGVLYQAADDVDDLLVPFIAKSGGTTDVAQINALYHEASLGKLTPDRFWAAVGLSPDVEDAYLAEHRTVSGLAPFLKAAWTRFRRVACLSNDVGRWSQKLRTLHGIAGSLSPWIISADVGSRKPAPEIYLLLLDALDAGGPEVLFVDDRPKNLDMARGLGIQTLCMNPLGKGDPGHPSIRSLDEVLALWDGWR